MRISEEIQSKEVKKKKVFITFFFLKVKNCIKLLFTIYFKELSLCGLKNNQKKKIIKNIMNWSNKKIILGYILMFSKR